MSQFTPYPPRQTSAGATSYTVVTGSGVRDVINVRDYGALGLGPGTNDLDAFRRAFAAASSSDKAVYAPEPPVSYELEFSRAAGHVSGSLTIDWPNFELYGDGKDRTIINCTSYTRAVAQRVSHVDQTIVRGRVASVSAGTTSKTITLQTAADKANFRQGDMLWFATGSDGSGERGLLGTGSDPEMNRSFEITNTNSNIQATGNITINNTNLFASPQVGDYIFVRYKIQLGAGEAANIDAGSGIQLAASITGTNFRSTADGVPLLVTHVDTEMDTISYQGLNNELSGSIDGDYIFVRPAFKAFHHTFGREAQTASWNSTYRDLTINCEKYPNSFPDVVNNSISCYPVYYTPYTSTVPTVPYICRFKGVSLNGGSGGVAQAASGFPIVTFWFSDSDLSGSTSNIGIFVDNTDDIYCRVIADRTEFRSTAYSHNCYIHSHVAISFDRCLFDDTGYDTGVGHGEGIDHWGQYQSAIESNVTNCYFGPKIKGRAYMTSTNGAFNFVGNTVESRTGIGVRTHGNIIGNVFRPVAPALTAASILPYFLAGENMHVQIQGNFFDAGRVSGSMMTAIEVGHGRWTIEGNAFTCAKTSGTNYDSTAGPDVYDGTDAIFVKVATDAHTGSYPAEVIVRDNIMSFLPSHTAGRHQLVLLESFPDTTIEGNRFVGTALSSNYGAIYGSLTGDTGAGKVRVKQNKIDVTAGHGIFFVDNGSTGAARVEMSDNEIVGRTAARTGIRLSGSGGSARFVLKDNDIQVFGSGTSLQLAAGAIEGNGNKVTTPMFFLNRQSFRPAQRMGPTTLSDLSTVVTMEPNYDAYVVTGTMATLHVSGGASATRGFDGSTWTMVVTGSLVAQTGGNVVFRMTGSRSDGTVLRFYNDVRNLRWLEI
jgi:hypothetical protein